MADQDWKTGGPKAAYFVLRIDCEKDGTPHDPHARVALAQYARAVQDDNPQLADEIDKWLVGTGPQYQKEK